MHPTSKLIAIKLLHTLIWLFFVSIIFYIVYCALANDISTLTWVAIALVVAEGIVLLLFKMSCPLTLVARKYSDSTRDNFDIYLPNWLAKHNKLIFTSIFLVAVAIILVRVFLSR